MNSNKHKKLNVAVIGYGHLGKWHCEKVRTSDVAHLKAIVDPSSLSRNRAKEVYSETIIVSNLEELGGIEIDAAIVVVPTIHHFEVTQHLLEKGIHVFCEKPLVSRMDHGETLKKMVKEKDVILQVGHSERFHEAWERKSQISKFLDGRAIIKFNRKAVSKGRAKDVDVVQDLMIHDLDLLNFLIGERPSALRAWGSKMVNDKWDSVTAEFKFPSGKVAFLTSTRNYVEEKRYLSATNEKGCLLIDFLNHKLKTNEALGERKEFVLSEKTYSKRDHLKIEQDLFYSSIVNGEPVAVNVEDGLKAMNLVEKVLKSLEDQKELIL